jgi:hypothetical protein
LIRTLIPLGLMALCEEFEREVVSLAGPRHSRKPEDAKHYRHGTNPGTVRLAGQRVLIKVPRVQLRLGLTPCSSTARGIAVPFWHESCQVHISRTSLRKELAGASPEVLASVCSPRGSP